MEMGVHFLDTVLFCLDATDVRLLEGWMISDNGFDLHTEATIDFQGRPAASGMLGSHLQSPIDSESNFFCFRKCRRVVKQHLWRPRLLRRGLRFAKSSLAAGSTRPIWTA